jgi:hypothetical protein
MIIKGQKLKPVKSSSAWQEPEPAGFEESFLADTTEPMLHVPRQKSEHQHAGLDHQGALPKRRAVGAFDGPTVAPSINAAQKASIQHELDKMRAEAHTQGYEAGLNAAEHELQQLRIVIAELFGLKQSVLLSSADDISGLALQVAQHVLQHEL